jgi:hypothetical protein
MVTKTSTIPVPATLAEVANKSEDRETIDLVLEIQEYESLDEFAQECGGEDKAIIVVNRYRTRNAIQAAKNKINNTVGKIPAGDNAAYEELLNKAQDMASQYKFEVTDGISAKEIKDKALEIRDRFLSMSPAERQSKSADDILAELGLI